MGDPEFRPDASEQEGALDRYERLAAEFYAETGMMAPGKDDPTGHHFYADRCERWCAWLDARQAGETEWEVIDCPHCVNGIIDRGYLEVSPKECPECVGGRQVVHRKTGTVAQYPGGPLRGRLTERERSCAPSSGPQAGAEQEGARTKCAACPWLFSCEFHGCAAARRDPASCLTRADGVCVSDTNCIHSPAEAREEFRSINAVKRRYFPDGVEGEAREEGRDGYDRGEGFSEDIRDAQQSPALPSTGEEDIKHLRLVFFDSALHHLHRFDALISRLRAAEQGRADAMWRGYRAGFLDALEASADTRPLEVCIAEAESRANAYVKARTVTRTPDPQPEGGPSNG